MTPRHARLVLQCSMVAMLASCGQGAGTTCTRDDECASHFCKADGTCGPAGVDASGGSDAPSDFASATYAAPLAASSDLVGVFRVASDRVELLGVVSPDAGPTRTELTYDPPARILALPFGAASSWTSTSTVSGIAQGVIVAYS